MAQTARHQHPLHRLGPPDDLLRQARALAASLGRADLARARLNSAQLRGQHGRRRAGQGEDFWQFRGYEASDPAERIDWRRSGRGDQLYIREREWDTAQTLFVWLDQSPSMWFSGAPGRPHKAVLGALIALAAASVFTNGGERAALLGHAMKPASGAAAPRRLAEALCQQRAAARLNAPGGTPVPAGSHVLLISDFLDPVPEWAARIKALARPGVGGHCLCLLDPVEADFPFKGRVRFQGLEGEHDETLGRAEDVRAHYSLRLDAQLAAVRDACRQAGWSMTRHISGASATACLLAIVTAMAGDHRQGF